MAKSKRSVGFAQKPQKPKPKLHPIQQKPGLAKSAIEERLFGVYQTAEQLGKELQCALRGMVGSAKGTVLSVEHSVSQQLRQRLQNARDLAGEIDASLRAQLLDGLGKVFAQTAAANAGLPTPQEVLQALYPQAIAPSNVLAVGDLLDDSGNLLTPEVAHWLAATFAASAPLLTVSPDTFATVQAETLSRAPQPIREAWANLVTRYSVDPSRDWTVTTGGSSPQTFAIAPPQNLAGGFNGQPGVMFGVSPQTSQTLSGAFPLAGGTQESFASIALPKPGPSPIGGVPGLPNPPNVVIPPAGPKPGLPPIFPGGGVAPPQNCPPPMGYVIPSGNPGVFSDGKGGLAIWNPLLGGWNFTVGGILPGQGFSGGFAACAQTPPPLPPLPPQTPPLPGPGFPPVPPPVYPPCPPPQNPCPVNVTVNCNDKCKPEEKECGIDVWCSSEGVVYVLPSGSPPRNSSDTKQTISATNGLNVSDLAKLCKTEETPPGQPGDKPLIPTKYGECEMLLPVLAADLLTNPDWVEQLLGLDTNVFTKAVAPVVKGLFGLTAQVGSFGLCTDPRFGGLAVVQALIGLIDRWTGMAPPQVMEAVRQSGNYLCPVILPSPAEATAAYLANTIDEQTLFCWVRSAGLKPESYAKVIEAQRTKLTAIDLVSLWRRRALTDLQLSNRLREIGYTSPQEMGELVGLSNQIPPVSDLPRFMVRDAADEALVVKFGLDSDFELKFTGQLKEWAYNQGVGDDYMRYIWRSHWAIPSPTQLFNFWQRLRHRPGFGGVDKVRDDIETALKQQDILPYWINAYLETSYRPPTRVDARRMFNRGLIGRQDLWNTFVDMGYSDENSERLTQFAEHEKKLQWRGNQFTKAFIEGSISDGEFNALLQGDGATVEEAFETAIYARRKQTISRRKVCNAAYRRRFLLGEFDSVETRQILINSGLDLDTANYLIESWECQKASVGKEIPANKLCAWYMDGIIDQPTLYQRLINLKYSSDDAVNLVRECELRTVQREQATQKRMLAELVRKQKEQEAQQRRLESEAERKASRAKANLERAQKASRLRKKLLLEIAFNFAQTTLMEMGDAVELVESIVKSIVASGPYTLDSVLQAGAKVSKLKSIISSDDLASEIAGAMESEDLEPEPV